MKELTEHRGSSVNNKLTVQAEPGSPAPKTYRVTYYERPGAKVTTVVIEFHTGSPEEIKGITDEVLLAIVADRLKDFQRSPFTCRENALALTKIQEGLMWLKKRTEDRQTRGVEGTQTI